MWSLVYVSPALIALLIKGYILLLSINKAKTNTVFFTLVFAFSAHNLSEVVAYLQYYNGNVSTFLFRIYYAATIVMLGSLALYIIDVCQLKYSKALYSIISVSALTLSTLIFFTDFVVAGVRDIGYAVTAERSSLFFLFEAYVLAVIIFAFAALSWKILNSESKVTMMKCLYSLIGFLPIIIFGFIVIPAMRMGFEFNAALALPLCTTFFVVLITLSERKHGLTDLRLLIPFTNEKRVANRIKAITSDYLLGLVDHKEFTRQIEIISLEYNLKEAKGNITKTSQLMGSHRTTVYSMINKHGLRGKFNIGEK